MRRTPNVRIAFVFIGLCHLWLLHSGLASGNEPTKSDHVGLSHGPWPFNSPMRPKVPAVQASELVKNPIDSFILARLEPAGLTLSAPSDVIGLLRRVSYSLTGLPPSVPELESFLADSSPEAYERAVERLLASPQFGPRWAQHWLDVVRYAESDGFKSDVLRPNAYRYRDYVINAFNDDLAYDRFIRQQLAGDELEPNNAQAIIATGLNRLYPDEDNAANLFQRRQEILDDITETNGLAFLGMTMGCAQCHDHKFDDILQADYFSLQAFFTPFVERDDILLASEAEQHEFVAKLASWEAATSDVRAKIDTLLRGVRDEDREYSLSKFEPAIQDCYRTSPEKRTPYQEQIARIAAKQVDKQNYDTLAKKLSPKDKVAYEQLKSELAKFNYLKPKPLPTAMAIADVGPQSPPTFLLDGGDWRSPLDEVQPDFPGFLASTGLSIQTKVGRASDEQSATGSSTGRRSELAGWLTGREHPLTARVIVNRLWHHHFGRGIVATPNDFGIQGDPPTHPELLDWLAVELIEHDWSLKHIHRLIVTSATYQQSSKINSNESQHALALQLDPSNQLWWRANWRRLEGEAIRDAMLSASELISLEMFGPSAKPKLPDGVSERYAWQADDDQQDQRRRAVFVLAKRNMRFPLFDAFDLPDMHNSCGCRTQSTTPPQALLMLNGEESLEVASDWAKVLEQRFARSPIQLVEHTYLAAFARRPSGDEIKMSLEFLRNHSSSQSVESLQSLSLEAVTDFCHALFNCNEFIYID